MIKLSFRMPTFNADYLERLMALLTNAPQPASGEQRLVRFQPTVGDFYQLEITYFQGARILMHYDATLKKIHNKRAKTTEYEFLCAEYVGEFARDFACGDVGPFWSLHRDPIFNYLNPLWQSSFHGTTAYEDVILDDVIKDMLVI